MKKPTQQTRRKKPANALVLWNRPSTTNHERAVNSLYESDQGPEVIQSIKTTLQYQSCVQLLQQLRKMELTNAQEIAMIRAQQQNRTDLMSFYQTEVRQDTPNKTFLIMAKTAVLITTKVQSLAVRQVQGLTQDSKPSQDELDACKLLDDRLAKLIAQGRATNAMRQALNLVSGLITGAVVAGYKAGKWLTSKVLTAVLALGGKLQDLCLYVLRSPRTALMALMAFHSLKRHLCTVLSHHYRFRSKGSKGPRRFPAYGGTSDLASGVWQYTKVLGPTEVARVIGANAKTTMSSTGSSVGAWLGSMTTVGLTMASGGIGAPAAMAVGAGVNAIVSAAFSTTGAIVEMATEQAVYDHEVKNCMSAFLAIIDIHECIDIYNEQMTLGEKEEQTATAIGAAAVINAAAAA